VINASVEFDVETLSPTYRLSIGLPGRSNALAIAARLGLPGEIIAGAREYVGTAGVEMEDLLHNLQTERQGAADERYHLSMERAEAEHLRKELERQRAELEEERARILNDARAQARREMEQIQAELARIRTQAQRPKLTEERLAALRSSARKLEERATPIATRARRVNEPTEETLSGPLSIGDTVYVRGMDQRGELVSLPDGRGEVEVQLGMLKLRVSEDDVVRLSRRQARSEPTSSVSIPRRADPTPVDLQLDLRGWRVEEALAEVDAYLNNAVMAGMHLVRLLHGKGTGALRLAIREQLAHHPLVKSFASAAANDGGDGVTVVQLAN
jgi:DNA mismatch repair protein MutS2